MIRKGRNPTWSWENKRKVRLKVWAKFQWKVTILPLEKIEILSIMGLLFSPPKRSFLKTRNFKSRWNLIDPGIRKLLYRHRTSSISPNSQQTPIDIQRWWSLMLLKNKRHQNPVLQQHNHQKSKTKKVKQWLLLRLCENIYL